MDYILQIWNAVLPVKLNTMKESKIQTEFFEKVKLFFPNIPDKLLFAVPNGGSRNIIEAANLKKQGVKSGVSDVICLLPNWFYNYLCIEFKTEKGKQSDDQIEFQKQVLSHGGYYAVARSAMEAIEIMKEYFKPKSLA